VKKNDEKKLMIVFGRHLDYVINDVTIYTINLCLSEEICRDMILVKLAYVLNCLSHTDNNIIDKV